MNDLLVHDLRIPGTNEWDAELIQELFLPDDVNSILSLPAGHSNTADRLVWNFEKNGLFSVRSGYRIAFSQLFGYDRHPVSWICFWSFHIPPKVKSFMWKLCIVVIYFLLGIDYVLKAW